MNQWTERIRDHRVWEEMKALGPSIDQVVALEDLDPSALEALERVRVVLTYAGRRLGGSDPLTMLPAPLDPIANAFSVARIQVDAFAGDRDPAHLAEANSAADKVLEGMSQVLGVATPQELVELIGATNAHRSGPRDQMQLASESRKQLTADVEKLESALAELKSHTEGNVAQIQGQLETERQKISAQAAEQQKLFADSQTAQSNTYNEALRKTQETLNKVLTDQQGQFSTAQENRNREFTTAQVESQKRFGELIGEYTKRLADQDAEFTKQHRTRSSRTRKVSSWTLRANILCRQISSSSR